MHHSKLFTRILAAPNSSVQLLVFCVFGFAINYLQPAFGEPATVAMSLHASLPIARGASDSTVVPAIQYGPI